MDVADEHGFFGVGSVLHIIPDIDISLFRIDIVKQLANAVFALYYNISRVYKKGVWDKLKKGISRVNDFVKIQC